MVTITTTGSSVIFEFENCPTYLQNGTIEVPKNALSLTVDGSGMATFRKAASNDIFVSVSLDELDMDEEELMEVFAEMCSTGGSEEEIQELSGKVSTISGSVTAHTSDNDIHVTTQDKSYWDGKADASDIEEAVSGKADTSAVTEEISAAVSGKADSSAVTEQISAAVSGKADSSAVTEEITAAVSGKADSSAVTEEIEAAVSGKADTSAVTEEITAAVSGKADSSAVTEEITAAVSGKADTSSLTEHTSDSTVHVTSTDKTSWNEAVTALGGVKLVKITQSAYDQLQTKDPDTLYIITAS